MGAKGQNHLETNCTHTLPHPVTCQSWKAATRQAQESSPKTDAEERAGQQHSHQGKTGMEPKPPWRSEEKHTVSCTVMETDR